MVRALGVTPSLRQQQPPCAIVHYTHVWQFNACCHMPVLVFMIGGTDRYLILPGVLNSRYNTAKLNCHNVNSTVLFSFQSYEKQVPAPGVEPRLPGSEPGVLPIRRNRNSGDKGV